MTYKQPSEELSPAGLVELALWLVGRRKRVRIAGTSMAPHLHDGDEILVDLHAYRRTTPQPGDVVLAQHPYRRDLRLVKRVEAVLERDRYKLWGDNPSESSDSRTFGDMPRSHILGRVTCIFTRR